MRSTGNVSPVAGVAAKIVKFFLLVLVGLVFAWVFSVLLNATSVSTLLVGWVEQWLFRVGAFVVCVMAIAVITESAR
jgi:hypothetical protein